jgi:hypothetical protein
MKTNGLLSRAQGKAGISMKKQDLVVKCGNVVENTGS